MSRKHKSYIRSMTDMSRGSPSSKKKSKKFRKSYQSLDFNRSGGSLQSLKM